MRRRKLMILYFAVVTLKLLLDELDPDKIDKDKLQDAIDDVTTDIKKLNGPIAGKSRSKDPNKQKEAEELKHDQDELLKYKGRLIHILGMASTYGQGIKHHNPYKVSPNGQYGNLIINLNKLYSQNKLIAKDRITGKEVINTKVDNDLIDLINKRYNNNKKHSIHSRKIFKELTEKSGLPINKRSMKFKKVIRGQGYDVCPCNPEELVNDLELICGSIDAGNNNEELKNEGIRVVDQLSKMNKLLPEQHEMLYKKYFS
ncbi:uncharacterized protein LOC128558705 isoform X2 [Mercenaria mercenaria]|uniref:uncharacterized protein LOC128558705 isoform X2 n=1 Tax=Mercenaria mercenaria TaxID=6596 RepID=UPI00234E9F7A|nr:uncharacterized protein LOC128558705 isoform X2 [Mercenaria mercenaria]